MHLREQVLEKKCVLYESALKLLAHDGLLEASLALEQADTLPADDKLVSSLPTLRRLHALVKEKRAELAETTRDRDELEKMLDAQEQQFYDVQRERDTLAQNELYRAQNADTIKFAVWGQHPDRTTLLKQLITSVRMLLVGEDLRDPHWLHATMRGIRVLWDQNQEFLMPFAEDL